MADDDVEMLSEGGGLAEPRKDPPCWLYRGSLLQMHPTSSQRGMDSLIRISSLHIEFATRTENTLPDDYSKPINFYFANDEPVSLQINVNSVPTVKKSKIFQGLYLEKLADLDEDASEFIRFLKMPARSKLGNPSLSASEPKKLGFVYTYEDLTEDSIEIVLYIKEEKVLPCLYDAFWEGVVRSSCSCHHAYITYVVLSKFLKDKKKKQRLELSLPARISRAGELEHQFFKELTDNFEVFFDRMFERRKRPQPYQLNTESLCATLRPYQRDAVCFMIDRELHPEVEMGDLFYTLVINKELVYFPNLGVFTSSAKVHFEPPVGGILADQMGLGKTVELLALITSFTPDHTPKVRAIEEDEVVDEVHEVLNELISYTVASIEGQKGLKQILPKKPVMNRVHEFNFFEPKPKRKRAPYAPEAMVRCTKCEVKCVQRKVHWTAELNELHDFVCPVCIANTVNEKGPTPVKSTLIVMPSAILHQWYEEIRKHIKDSVTIDVYNGVGVEGYKHPRYLERFDIVLCTYETLLKELVFKENYGSKYEFRKRGADTTTPMTSSTPLNAVEWWRLILDESQMIERSSSAMTRMSAEIPARARWCVTGTPLTASVHDVSQLLSFLRMHPLSVDTVFDRLLWDPYEKGMANNLLSVVSQLFWRTSKKNLSESYNLSQPKVHRHVELLDLTPLEERAYRAELSKQASKIYEMIQKYPRETLISELPRSFHLQFQTALSGLRYRILCPESAADSGPKKASAYSPAGLYDKLIEIAQVEFSSTLRSVVMRRNEMAGLHLLLGKKDEAEKWYRCALEAINSAAEMWSSIQDDIGKERGADATQIMHVVRNLVWLNPTNRDGLELAEELAKKAFAHYTRVEAEMVDGLFVMMKSAWSEDVVEQLLASNWHSRLIAILISDKSNTKCEAKFVTDNSGAGRLASANPDEMLVQHRECVEELLHRAPELIRMIEDCRAVVMWEDTRVPERAFWRRLDFIQEGFVMTTPYDDDRDADDETFDRYRSTIGRDRLAAMYDHALECQHAFSAKARHLADVRPENITKNDEETDDGQTVKKYTERTKKVEENKDSERELGAYWEKCQKCILCRTQATVNLVARLLNDNNGSIQFNITRLQDVYSRMLRYCKRSTLSDSIRTQLEALVIEEETTRNFQTFMFMLKSMCTHWNEFSEFATERLFRIRELYSSTMRLRPGTPLNVNGIEAIELGRKSNNERAVRIVERIEAQWTSKLARTVTNVRYIRNLKDSGKEQAESDRQEECPICFAVIGDSWFVFPCAHRVCTACRNRLFRMHDGLRCPVCRAAFEKANVFFVARELSEYSGYSVKFGALMRRITSLLSADKSSKMLVFTSLNQAMLALSNLLQRAELPFLVFNVGAKLNETLARFRNDPSVRILLMDLAHGGKGLNLTVANHVIFTEPSCDASMELQAIGRVDRIGQRKDVHVHQIIVRGTLEEELAELSRTGTGDTEWTVGTLHNIFDIDEQLKMDFMDAVANGVIV